MENGQVFTFPNGLTGRHFGPLELPTRLFAIPGGPSISAAYLHTFVQQMAQALKIHAVLVDLPNHGTNQAMSSKEIDYQRTVDLIRSAFGSIHTPKVLIYGHSFGARIALEIAKKEQTKISALLLMSMPIALTHSSKFSLTVREKGLSDARISDEISFQNYWKNILPLYFGSPPETATTHQLVHETFYSVSTRMSEGLSELSSETAGFMDSGAIATLYQEGDLDIILPDNNFNKIKHLFPKWRSAKVPAAAHFPVIENAPYCLAQIEKFLLEYQLCPS